MRCGISGGERRRLSIAMELLTFPQPSCLLLDECTSGLDSQAALELVRVLQSLAKDRGLAVLASLHQPSWKLCEMADGVVILHEGNKVYHGDWQHAEQHFTAFGSATPPHENPADHFLLGIACTFFDHFVSHTQIVVTNPLKGSRTNVVPS